MDESAIRVKHIEASRSYAPSKTNLLFLAESPPASPDRYFYFPQVRRHDQLWVALMKGLYGNQFGNTASERKNKRARLTRFANDGYQLIDALKSPNQASAQRRKLLIRERADDVINEVSTIARCKELMSLPLRLAPNRIGARKKPCPENKRRAIFDAFHHFGML